MPNAPLHPELLAFARELRQRHTDAERRIWAILRGRRFLGLKFRRQHPLAPYVLDFYCHEKKLAIELDGGQHNTTAGRAKDERRTRAINQQGIRVIRFWDHDVLQDTEAVLEAIYRAVTEEERKNPHPGPLPEGEGA
jgi:type I restriction enzyme M protein